MTPFESLRKLSEPVQTRLRSSQILTSLPQIVSELIHNSLDAAASHIDIGVDCREWECWVKDDGHGISKRDLVFFSKGHNVGRYNTSKAYTISSLDDVNTFGFRGEALASAADVSCLEISSRSTTSGQTWTVITKSGRCLYHGLATRWRRDRPGTVVYLRDIFHNLPIRRTSHSRPSRTMEIICRDVETLALVFPGVSFTVSNTREPADDAPPISRVLSIPKTSSTLARFRHINGRTLVDQVDEISACLGTLKLEGFMSLRGASTKAHQYLFINRHPLSSSHYLHRTIDYVFSISSFSKHVADDGILSPAVQKHVRRSPRKVDRRAVYVLTLTMPPKDVDNCLELGKSLVHISDEEAVVAFIDSVIRDFLIRHNFLLRNEGSSMPRKKRKLDERNRAIEFPDLRGLTLSPSRASKAAREPLSNDRREIIQPDLHANTDDNANEDGELTWTDPITGVTFVIDRRTGHSYPSAQLRIAEGEEVCEQSSEGHNEIPTWIREALKGNRAYTQKEQAIPSMPQPSPNIPVPEYATHPADITGHNHPSNDLHHEQSIMLRLQRSDLARMEVLSQLDRKFIVCAINALEVEKEGRHEMGGPNRMLFLVDQHAASERIRVEGFLKTLCLHFLGQNSGVSQDVFRIQLTPARPVLLRRREAATLVAREEVRSGLERWGFDLRWPELVHYDQDADLEVPQQILVHSIPQVVSEKLLAGSELQDFLRGCAAESEADDVPPALSVAEHERAEFVEPESWHKALRWCPRGLVELVNSRACRGAIMFNDVLSTDQCRRLVDQLATTSFPFQCAHGRPSLVSLAGTSERASAKGRLGRIDWARSGLTLASASEVESE
ncbi:hypothetical protein BC834DRAFT_880631 [Gloeopeniophorella convolvens]|nr:hypothetical protein BC834DRAFT_880631 [Gloeopeniophorella convolvens]